MAQRISVHLSVPHVGVGVCVRVWVYVRVSVGMWVCTCALYVHLCRRVCGGGITISLCSMCVNVGECGVSTYTLHTLIVISVFSVFVDTHECGILLVVCIVCVNAGEGMVLVCVWMQGSVWY